MHIQKQGVLKLFEIYEFIKIISYFEYLKAQKFEGKISEWLEKIEIPAEISKVIRLFDEKGEIKTVILNRWTISTLRFQKTKKR